MADCRYTVMLLNAKEIEINGYLSSKSSMSITISSAPCAKQKVMLIKLDNTADATMVLFLSSCRQEYDTMCVVKGFAGLLGSHGLVHRSYKRND